MFYTLKKEQYILIILLFSLLALLGLGIDISANGLDSNEVRPIPDQAVQPGQNSPVHEDIFLEIASRLTTQGAGSPLMHVSDSSQKASGLQVLPTHGVVTITSNADFASHPNITGSGTQGDPG